MQFDFTPTPLPILANDAEVAMRTARPETQDENTLQIASLQKHASDVQVAEHIRGMVAATMAKLSIHATDFTLENANLWQQWALEVADNLAVTTDSKTL